jgi:hypothetical protein
MKATTVGSPQKPAASSAPMRAGQEPAGMIDGREIMALRS